MFYNLDQDAICIIGIPFVFTSVSNPKLLAYSAIGIEFVGCRVAVLCNNQFACCRVIITDSILYGAIVGIDDTTTRSEAS